MGRGCKYSSWSESGPLSLLRPHRKESLLKRLNVELILTSVFWRAATSNITIFTLPTVMLVHISVFKGVDSMFMQSKKKEKSESSPGQNVSLYFWDMHLSGPCLSMEKEGAVGNICLFSLLADKLYTHLVSGRWERRFYDMIWSTQFYDNKPLYQFMCAQKRGLFEYYNP